MCKPKIPPPPAVRRMATPRSDAAMREGEVERLMRRNRGGVAADILTSPLGLVGDAG